MIRQPIVTIMGHVDHGKTMLLDKIRGSAIQAKESGGITQAIGASIIPLDTIKKICGPLLEALKLKFTIPGILFIDTPGHAAFVNLRKRGGNLADIAILVIDINEGIKAQTRECIEILKQYKTPFIISANKIDLVPGWHPSKENIIKNISSQPESTRNKLETKLYEIVGKLFEIGLEADRYDRINNYTKQIAIVPTSAKTGEGIPELLMVLTGLTQRYLEKELKISVEGPCKATILEVKEEKGLGKTLDAIIHDGTLKIGDEIVIGTMGEPIVTKVKGLFMPAPLTEMRDKKSKFKTVKEVSAANGVKIIVIDIEEATSGMPLLGVDRNTEKIKEQVKKEIQEVIVKTDKQGVIIKADSLGSLEALITLLKEKNIPIKKASIGPITKKDISDAEANLEKDPLHAVILGFNIPQAQAKVKTIVHDVIYKVIEDYETWYKEESKKMELEALENLTKPCKLQSLKGYVFRQSNPAVIGVEVLEGSLKSNIPIMNTEGKILTTVKSIQKEQENVERAERGDKVAISLPHVIIGRQVKEGDILLSAITEEEFRKFREYKKYLSESDKTVLKEIAKLMRKRNQLWGL